MGDILGCCAQRLTPTGYKTILTPIHFFLLLLKGVVKLSMLLWCGAVVVWWYGGVHECVEVREEATEGGRGRGG